jgi:hypothetical protein
MHSIYTECLVVHVDACEAGWMCSCWSQRRMRADDRMMALRPDKKVTHQHKGSKRYSSLQKVLGRGTKVTQYNETYHHLPFYFIWRFLVLRVADFINIGLLFLCLRTTNNKLSDLVSNSLITNKKKSIGTHVGKREVAQ